MFNLYLYLKQENLSSKPYKKACLGLFTLSMFGIFLLLLVIVPTQKANSQNLELTTAKPITQKWLLGKTYTYQFSLSASQYVEIELDEKNPDETLLETMKVTDPDGKLIADTDGFASFTSEKAGNYKVEIKAKDEMDESEKSKKSSTEYTVKLSTSELSTVKMEYPLVGKKTFQDYEARFYGKDDEGGFELLKSNSRIYLQKGGRFWVGEEEFNNEEAKENNLVDMGRDITGDKEPDLVVQEATGEDCCRTVYVYQISKEFKRLATIYVGDQAEVSFEDLNGDGLVDLSVTDDTFSSWQVEEVSAPVPSVILNFRDGSFHLALDLMRESAPNLADLKAEADKARDSGWDESLLEEAPWTQMVYLVYSGHPGLAWTFLEMAWPSAVENSDVAKADFLADFQKQLAKSPYWSELKTISILSKPPVRVGYIDKTGQTTIEPQYKTITEFDEELAPILLDGKYGYINTSGKLVIKPQFADAGNFSEGLAVVGVEVKDNVLYGYIDKTGNIVIKPQFADAKAFSEGLAAVGNMVKDNILYGYIDKTGKILIKAQFVDAENFSEGLAAIGVEEKETTQYGYIDKSGKVIIKPQYDEAKNFSEGLAAVGLEEEDETYSYGYIDKTGKAVIKLQYDEAENFSEGLAVVQIEGKYGFIDKTGKLVITNQYEEAETFANGLALVLVKDKYGYIDKTGKLVIDPQYVEAKSFVDELALVKVKDKYGYIDKTGKTVIKPQFDEACDFHKGFAPILSYNH